ncbi:uncharacterized protein [Onthophagus taurus]|uniref:uncharacterized protein n=1 Tax=Onthophagus taurus TaxID=166361 RepID=UPI0039BE052E
MEATIDALEKRLKVLELQILPQDKPVDLKSQNIVDYLAEAHEMITMALSCRDAVSNMLQKLQLIHEYLNPSFCSFEDLTEMRQYILDLYPDLKKTVDYLKQFAVLKPIIDADYCVNQELTGRLSSLTVSATNGYVESESTKDEVKTVLKDLQEMTYSYKMLFAQLEYSMALIEEALKSKSIIKDE